jgi:hypothetical protein
MPESVVRWQQSFANLDRLGTEFDNWFKQATATDTRCQYTTQLASMRNLVRPASARVRQMLKVLDYADEAYTGPLFEDCRRQDIRLVWIRRIWDYFRQRFDQRFVDKKLVLFLHAAEEVVWSCFKPPFERISEPSKVRVPAAPLPFVEAWYSPAAIPPQPRFFPPDLMREVDRYFQSKVLTRLPIPVLRIPPGYVDAPWWLVFLGHEIGHHIQFTLFTGPEDPMTYDRCEPATDPPLVTHYRELVFHTVEKASSEEKLATEWAGWSEELFADVVSVITMGPGALWALAGLEWAGKAKMVQRRDSYPPAVVRLRFLQEVADQLGLNSTGAIRSIDLEKLAAEDPSANRDLKLVPRVVEVSLDKLQCLPAALPELFAFDAADYGRDGQIDYWKNQLLQVKLAPAEESLRAARQIVSGALEAWREIASKTDDPAARAERGQKLSGKLLDLLVRSREVGQREAKASHSASAKLGEDFADALFEADAAALERGLQGHAF